MRSFQGRDILSLKDFERNEFFHVFEVGKALEPIARSRSASAGGGLVRVEPGQELSPLF